MKASKSFCQAEQRNSTATAYSIEIEEKKEENLVWHKNWNLKSIL